MYPPAGPDTLWLDFANVLLGLVTLLCVAVVGAGVVVELMQRLRVADLAEDAHALAAPDLGVTIAGGGERLDRHDRPRTKAWPGPGASPDRTSGDDGRTTQGVGRAMS
jgi:hypothetical protein